MNPYGMYDRDSSRSQDGRSYVWPGKNRSPDEYPYSFDPYYVARAEDFDIKKHHGVDHDRMIQWDGNKYRAAFTESGVNFRCPDLEKLSDFLTRYYGNPTTCKAIARGCNQSSGYEIWSIWFAHHDE